MSRIWRQLAIATNWPVLVAVLVLSALGTVSIWAFAGDVRKQIIFLAIGLACMFLVQTVNYQRIGQFAWTFYALSLLLLIYTVVPLTHVPNGDDRLLRVPETNYTYAWINFGILRLQPAELSKIALCMVLARYLRFRSNYRTVAGLLPPFALALVPLVLILKQPDLGTALVFIPALFAMLFVAGAKIRHLLTIVALAVVLAPIAWFAGPASDTGMSRDFPVLRHLPALVKEYQRGRVYALFSSDSKIIAKYGFQPEKALTAFGSGGFSGKGALNIPAGKKVPEGHNDMIFALIGEQFGFIGSAIVLGAYLVLFVAGIEIAAATREPFGRLLAIGIVSILAGQTFLNLMVTVRLMPVTGITLPFVSYGGSSILASFIAIGLLLNIGRNRPLVMANDAFEFDE